MTQESTVATHLSNVGVIVLIPQSFTDQEKSMYLAFRDEMRAVLLKSESTPDYYWMDHFSGDSEMLIAHYDDRRR